MGRARSIQSGDGTAGVRVEYVKTRRVVRLGGWHGDREIRPIEVPASRFLDDLGIAPEELGATPIYLVLASVQQSRTRGMRHLAAAFPSEIQARQVFMRLRAAHQDPDEWAQVVALDARCRMVPLCWFGNPGLLNAGGLERASTREEGRAATDVEEARPPARPRRWGARHGRGDTA